MSQRRWIFEVDPVSGYCHLLAGRGKRVAAVYTSGVWGPQLGPKFGSDFQATYLNDRLQWTDLTDISEIRFHPTLTGDWGAARQGPRAQARELAKAF